MERNSNWQQDKTLVLNLFPFISPIFYMLSPLTLGRGKYKKCIGKDREDEKNDE